MKLITRGALALAICAMTAPSAYAQMQWTDRGFVNVNGGNQTRSSTLATESTFDIYGEVATVGTGQTVRSGGLFDVSAGVKVWRNLAIGVGYSRTSRSSDAQITASIPDPLVFDAPRAVTASLTDAQHTEQMVHLQGVWMIPVTDKIDVGISFGPSIFIVSQELPGEATVTEPGPVVTVARDKVDKTAVGGHVGVDVNYLITKRVGAGVLLRYAGASVDIPGVTESLSVGGFQIGVGARLRF